MVLDTIEEGDDGQKEFVFKNTYEENKQVKIKVYADEAPEEFFFLDIKLAPSSLETRSACASMLQTSGSIFIRQCQEQGLIGKLEKEKLEKYIMEEERHRETTRDMLTLVPKPLHEYGNFQAAYLRATVSKVRSTFNLIHYHFVDFQFNCNAVKGTRLLAPS